MKKNLFTALLFFFCFLLFSCSGGGREQIEGGKEIITEAELLQIQDFDNHTIVSILNAKDSTGIVARYVLLNDTATEPANLPEDATIIRTPLKRMLVYSTVFASALDELGKVDVVKGVVDAQYFRLPAVKAGLEAGSISDVGTASSPSIEKVVMLKPEAILLSIYEGMDVGGLEKANVPIIKFADNLESKPLGRAEWIRFLGRLVGETQKADSIFFAVRDSYNALKTNTTAAKKTPKILTDNIYQGVWYVPGGRSYQANMIADAGGAYFMNKNASVGSLPLSFEEVLANGEDADLWLLKTFADLTDSEALKKMDERYSRFAPFRNGNIFYCNSAQSSVFEDIPFHPDLLLREYMFIFSNQPDSLRYFKRLPK